MDTGLRGRTVLITGASANMGKYTALAFAREGANLALCTSSKMPELEQVAREARELGVEALPCKCDVTDPASVDGFVQQAHARFGRIDVALNLAGYRAEKPFLEEDLETVHRTIAVNLMGPYHICRAVIPHMMERRWGRILNTAGIAPYMGTGAAKAMVKLGTVGFTRGIAREFGAYGITANCFGPGGVERPRDGIVTEKPLRSTQPIPRKGSPQEAISVLLYLASEGAGFITGQCYLVNGGVYFQ